MYKNRLSRKLPSLRLVYIPRNNNNRMLLHLSGTFQRTAARTSSISSILDNKLSAAMDIVNSILAGQSEARDIIDGILSETKGAKNVIYENLNEAVAVWFSTS